MKTEEEIKAKIENYERMLEDEENQQEAMQLKLYAYLNTLMWVLK